MTLEGKALHWFQTLNPSSFLNVEQLEQEFIAAFSKTGLKHDDLSRIYGFKQEKGESIRECSASLRQYLTRCPQRCPQAEEPTNKD